MRSSRLVMSHGHENGILLFRIYTFSGRYQVPEIVLYVI